MFRKFSEITNRWIVLFTFWTPTLVVENKVTIIRILDPLHVWIEWMRSSAGLMQVDCQDFFIHKLDASYFQQLAASLQISSFIKSDFYRIYNATWWIRLDRCKWMTSMRQSTTFIKPVAFLALKGSIMHSNVWKLTGNPMRIFNKCKHFISTNATIIAIFFSKS